VCPPCGKTRFLPQAYQTRLILRGHRRVLQHRVAHQPRVCAQHAARLGVKNRLMPRELAASVLPAFRAGFLQRFFRDGRNLTGFSGLTEILSRTPTTGSLYPNRDHSAPLHARTCDIVLAVYWLIGQTMNRLPSRPNRDHSSPLHARTHAECTFWRRYWLINH
jgi:hypothetical protein